MLIAALTALMLQQSAGTIAWEAPPVTDAAPPTVVEVTSSSPALPDWAKADPFAWERSQCSPMIRKEASMEMCQVRVRTQLAAALGPQLPTGLSPEAITSCRQVSNGSGGYDLTCAPAQRTLTSAPAPVAEICEERPTATARGAVSFERQCHPATGAASQDGLKFRLGGD